MMSIIRNLACCSLMALVGMNMGYAQERAAGNAMETQMTWSTLANMVESANVNSKTANTRIDQIILCNKKFMAYAPGAPGADGDGCIENALIKALSKRMDVAEQDIKDTNAKLAALDSRVTEEVKRIDGSLADLGSKVAALNTRVGAVEKGVAALEGRMAAVETAVKTLNTKVAALEKDVDKLEADVAKINKDIAAINKDIAALEKDVSTLQAQVKDNTADINKMLACARKGQLFNDSTNKCVSATSSSKGCTVTAESLASGGMKFSAAGSELIGDMFGIKLPMKLKDGEILYKYSSSQTSTNQREARPASTTFVQCLDGSVTVKGYSNGF